MSSRASPSGLLIFVIFTVKSCSVAIMAISDLPPGLPVVRIIEREKTPSPLPKHYMVFAHAATGRCPRSLVRFASRRSRSAFPTLPHATSEPAADPAYARLPRALWWTLSRPGAQLVYSQLPLERSTGLEPVTPRFSVWCSAIELRQLTANFRTHPRNASNQSVHEAQCAAGERQQSDAYFKETPAGVEPAESCFAGSRRTVWLQRLVKSPAANDGRSFVIRL